MGTGTGSPHALRLRQPMGRGGNMSQAEQGSWHGLCLLNQGGKIPPRPPSLPGEGNTHTWGAPLLGGEHFSRSLWHGGTGCRTKPASPLLSHLLQPSEPICSGSQTGAEPAAGRVPGSGFSHQRPKPPRWEMGRQHGLLRGLMAPDGSSRRWLNHLLLFFFFFFPRRLLHSAPLMCRFSTPLLSCSQRGGRADNLRVLAWIFSLP